MPTKNRFKNSLDNAAENTKDSIKGDIKESAKDSIKDSIKESTKDSILQKVLQGSKKGKGGNHTIYLSAEVGDALVKVAKRNKKSKSMLVDEILREVLLTPSE